MAHDNLVKQEIAIASEELQGMKVELDEHQIKLEPWHYQKPMELEKDTYNNSNEYMVGFGTTLGKRVMHSEEISTEDILMMKEHLISDARSIVKNKNTNISTEIVRIQKENKPNQCIYCNKFFKYKKGLVVHQKIHTGEFFQYNKCDKRFSQKYTLVNHYKTHTGEMPLLEIII